MITSKVSICRLVLVLVLTVALSCQSDAAGIFERTIAQARLINSDTQGWLYVPGTNVSYPLLQNKGVCSTHGVSDNCYYLSRNIYGRYAGAFDNSAAIFMDYRNSGLHSLDRNTIVYGHNWTNIETGPLRVADNSIDFMFAQLPSFADRDFASRTPYFLVETGDAQLIFVVFAAGYVNCYSESRNTGFYYLDTNPSDARFMELVLQMRAYSVFDYDVEVTPDDKIMTLSTCTYKQTRDGSGRFVVMGRLLHEGESVPTVASFREANRISVSIG